MRGHLRLKMITAFFHSLDFCQKQRGPYWDQKLHYLQTQYKAKTMHMPKLLDIICMALALISSGPGMCWRDCIRSFFSVREVNLIHLGCIAAVVHKQITHQTHVHCVPHTLHAAQWAGWVASPACDKTRIKPHQPVRNLPSSSSHLTDGKIHQRQNSPHGAFSKQAWKINTCTLNPTWMP